MNDKVEIKKESLNHKKVKLVVIISFVILLGIFIYFFSRPITFSKTNLKDYFGDYKLSTKRNVKYHCGGGPFGKTCSTSEWDISFKDYNGVLQEYTLSAKYDFDEMVAIVASDILEKQVKNMVTSAIGNNFDKLTTVFLVSYESNDFFRNSKRLDLKEFKPKEVNIYDFSSNNKKTLFKIYTPITSDEDIERVADLLISKSKEPINFCIIKKVWEEGSFNYCGDINYFRNVKVESGLDALIENSN